MNSILSEPIEEYLKQKEVDFTNNPLANKMRGEFPERIKSVISDQTRYEVVGSPGKGNWADCPWFAILDTLITETPQSGYYPVFLFKADMTGVYLSLNQGVTEVKDNYKRETKEVLRLRAENFRAKIDVLPEDVLTIALNSTNTNARLYEAGNIVARYYSASNLPNSEQLRADIFRFLHLYEELTFNDTNVDDQKDLTAIEKKQIRLHFRIERNTSISKRVKQIKGCKCEACDFDFKSKYGDLGKDFIEAHHLKPIASLEIGKFKIDLQNDFAVLCSNCHSMIHRLDDVSDIQKLRKIIQSIQK